MPQELQETASCLIIGRRATGISALFFCLQLAGLSGCIAHRCDLYSLPLAPASPGDQYGVPEYPQINTN